MSDKRKRTIKLTVRLSESEKQIIRRKANNLGMSIADYIVALSLKVNISASESIKPLLTEMKRIEKVLGDISILLKNNEERATDFRELLDAHHEMYNRLHLLAINRGGYKCDTKELRKGTSKLSCGA